MHSTVTTDWFYLLSVIEQRKISIICLAMCLVVLQLLSPFVHAHFDANASSAQASGLHMHPIQHREIARQSLKIAQQQVTIQSDSQDMQMVVIGNGVIKELELPDFGAAVFLVALLLVVLTTLVARVQPLRRSQPPNRFLLNSLSPRAPPYC